MSLEDKLKELGFNCSSLARWLIENGDTRSMASIQTNLYRINKKEIQMPGELSAILTMIEKYNLKDASCKSAQPS